jgi:putative membrane protein
MRKPSIALAIGASVLMSGAAWAQAPMRSPWNHHMMWWGGEGSWYGMLFGPLFMIIIFAVLIGAALFFFRGPSSQNTRPLDILKERYARGEIDKAEFDERRHTLGA